MILPSLKIKKSKHVKNISERKITNLEFKKQLYKFFNPWINFRDTVMIFLNATISEMLMVSILDIMCSVNCNFRENKFVFMVMDMCDSCIASQSFSSIWYFYVMCLAVTVEKYNILSCILHTSTYISYPFPYGLL